MARRTALTSLREMSEINMTPLIDLTFLLLITFIITFPLLEQGIPVNLPRGKAEELDRKQTRTITVDAQGTLYLDDLKISREELAVEMAALGRAQPDITVFVRADESLRYAQIVDVLAVLHEAKIGRVALVTQPEKRGGR